jgi:integrase/recombinase XerD
MKYSKEWLREDQIQKMLSVPTLSEKVEIWMLLLYTPALRISEAINVRVKDLDLKGACIEIYGGKGYDDTEMRKVPCDIRVLRRIKLYCDHHNLKPNDYVMFSNKGKQVSRSHVYVVVNQIAKEAGIGKTIGTHTFRRSRAEHLLDRGLPITFVSKYLRHKNLSTTMSYLDVSVADIQREMEKIDDCIGSFV